MAEGSIVPTPKPTQTGSRRWLLAVLVLVAFIALPSIVYPIGRDQATYCVIGQGLLRGQQLYRDLWDNKPPGIFWIYALVVKVFGPVMWSVGLVDILWLLAISYFIFRFAEHYLGTAAAVIAVLVNAGGTPVCRRSVSRRSFLAQVQRPGFPPSPCSRPLC